MARVAGPLPGILTLVLDGVKGAAAVWLAARFTDDSATMDDRGGARRADRSLLPGVAAISRRKRRRNGGGNVSGVCAGLRRWARSVVFILVVLFSRFVSLGSIAAAAAMPLLIYLLWAPHHAPPLRRLRLERSRRRCLVVYKHDANIQRLVEGREPRFSFGKSKGRARVTRIAILGAGSWGTALAVVLSRSPRAHEISLWVRDAGLAEEIRCKRENVSYLPGHSLPDQIRVAHELDEALSGATIVIGAMPSAHAREVYSAAADRVAPYTVVVSATKGLEPATHARMSEVIAQCPPRDMRASSGRSLRTVVRAGSGAWLRPPRWSSRRTTQRSPPNCRKSLLRPIFVCTRNDDVLGVELAGAMKNVIAIAAGTCQGLALGSNSLAALITRGLAEMSRLAVALGGRPETLSGLAGLGDLVLTCTGSLSRNRHVGMELGKGRLLAEIISGMHGVAEGVGTAAALLALAREHNIELPITTQVEAILHHGKSPREAIREIMERPQRKE